MLRAIGVFLKDRYPEVLFVVVLGGFAANGIYAQLNKPVNTPAFRDDVVASLSESRLTSEKSIEAKSTKPKQSTGTVKSSSTREYCSTRTIPYQKNTKYVSYLDEDESYSYGGHNGTEYYCIKDGVSRITARISPIDKTTYIGNRKPISYPVPSTTSNNPSTETRPRYSYSEAYNLATNNCRALLGQYGAVNSSAFPQCVNAYLKKFGY